MSREQFEAWYLENWGHTEDNHESLFERCQDGCGDEYYRLGVRMAYEAWQAASKASEQQLAAVVAENTGLKTYLPQPYGEAMMEALDAFFEREDVPEQGMMASFEILCCKRPPTPATDAAIANIQAQGVEMYAVTLGRGAEDAERDGFDDGMKFLRAEADGVRKFAAQLRQGAAL